MFKYGKLKPLNRETISTKQKDRVQQFGEVFTPENIIKDMLDLLPTKDKGKNLILNENTDTEKSYISSTFLEPSCGDGNFLVEVLNRKLNCVSLSSIDNDVLLAVSSIYGVDIQADNVLECRRRLYAILLDFYNTNNIVLSIEQDEKLNEILFKNIILGNTIEDRMLKVNNDGYLLDFVSEEVTDLLLVSDSSRFDTVPLLTNSGIVYRNSDIYDWFKSLNIELNAEQVEKIVKNLKDMKIYRLACYNWSINSGVLTSDVEFMIEKDKEEVKKVQVQSIDSLKAKFANLKFGK